jgi:hypothetical protein
MLCPEVVAGSEDEAENTPAPAAPLDLTPKNVTPPPVPAPAAPVVEIAATVSRTEPPQDTPALAAAGLAPVEPPPAPAPAATTSHSMTGSGAYISAATAAKVEELVGPHFDRAMAWFVKEKWLVEGESILRLTETRALRILKQSASWLRAIGAEGGAK